MSKRYKNTRRREATPVFFLDRNLGSEKLAGILRPLGFQLISHNEYYGSHSTNIDDPTIIGDCGRNAYVLLTADGDLEYTYASEIRAAKVAIFIVSNNHEGPEKWGPRIADAYDEIRLELRRRRKSFVGRITADAKVNQVRLYYKKRSKVIKIVRKKAK